MENRKEIDILDIILMIIKNKKLIIIPTIIISIITVVYVLIIPQYWTSSVTLKSIESNQGSLGLASSLLGLGAGFLGNINNTGSPELVQIMNSRTFSEDVIKTFNLKEYFEIEEPDSLMADDLALESLAQIMSFGINEETGFIYISCTTKDKNLSADMVNYYAERIEYYNVNNRMTSSRRQREFLEKRVESVEQRIDELTEELNQFQNENNVIDMNNQASKLIEVYTDLVSQATSIKLELDFTKEMLPSNSVAINTLQKKYDLINKEVNSLEYTDKENGAKYILNIDEIPDLSMRYAKIMSLIEIQKQIYLYIYPQYEEAKINEIKDLPTIEIIDKGKLAGLRTKPKRARTCIIVFLSSIILFSTIAIVKEMLTVEDKRKMKDIFLEIKKFK